MDVGTPSNLRIIPCILNKYPDNVGYATTSTLLSSGLMRARIRTGSDYAGRFHPDGIPGSKILVNAGQADRWKQRILAIHKEYAAEIGHSLRGLGEDPSE